MDTYHNSHNSLFPPWYVEENLEKRVLEILVNSCFNNITSKSAISMEFIKTNKNRISQKRSQADLIQNFVLTPNY